jgi:hypothetical protein
MGKHSQTLRQKKKKKKLQGSAIDLNGAMSKFQNGVCE